MNKFIIIKEDMVTRKLTDFHNTFNKFGKSCLSKNMEIALSQTKANTRISQQFQIDLKSLQKG